MYQIHHYSIVYEKKNTTTYICTLHSTNLRFLPTLKISITFYFLFHSVLLYAVCLGPLTFKDCYILFIQMLSIETFSKIVLFLLGAHTLTHSIHLSMHNLMINWDLSNSFIQHHLKQTRKYELKYEFLIFDVIKITVMATLNRKKMRSKTGKAKLETGKHDDKVN